MDPIPEARPPPPPPRLSRPPQIGRLTRQKASRDLFAAPAPPEAPEPPKGGGCCLVS